MAEKRVKLKNEKGLEMTLVVQDIFGLEDVDVLKLKKNPELTKGTVMVEMIGPDKGRLATIINIKDLEAAIRLVRDFDH